MVFLHMKLRFGGLVISSHPSIFFLILASQFKDNLSILTSYITKQNGTDPGEIRKYLEIGDDYEDIC